jgi:hypothetical protein
LGYLLFQIAQKVRLVYFWAIAVVKFAFWRHSTDEIREKYKQYWQSFVVDMVDQGHMNQSRQWVCLPLYWHQALCV